MLRWLHIICGVMWIGLLWYFNFVSTPTMPKIPDELKPALGSYITPAALFWFRWSAMGTIFFGIVLALRNHYLLEAYTLDLSEGTAGWPMVPKYLAIGIGMWLGTIMWFNVWFVIWPNQQKALNIGGKYPDLPADREGRRGQDRRDVQPHQHAALHSHAVLHGGGGASVLRAAADARCESEGRPRCDPGGFFRLRQGILIGWTALANRLAASVRGADPDRYFSALFAPARAAAAAVRALCLQCRSGAGGRNRARAHAGRHPAGMVARDRGRRAPRATPRNHDVARGLAALFAETAIALADLEALIAARAFDSSADQFRRFRRAGKLSGCHQRRA